MFRKLLKINHILILIAAVIIFFSLYSSFRSIKKFTPDVLSSISTIQAQSINEFDTSLSLPVAKCADIKLMRASYPRYWKGLDLKVNGIDFVDPSIGEFPSLEQALNISLVDNNSNQEISIQQVPSEFINRVELENVDCKLVYLVEEEYVICKDWMGISPNTNDYVSTQCNIEKCGKITTTNCLFPDYLGNYLTDYLSSSSQCIVSPNNMVCDTNEFIEYAHNYYKLNLSDLYYGED